MSDNFTQFNKMLDLFNKKRVLVGVVEDASSRKEGEQTNAEILYINTVGSAAAGIPPRPLLEPAIASIEEEIADMLRAAVRAGVDGTEADLIAGLELAGLRAQAAVIDWFDDPRNDWQPNSPQTIADKGSDKPLVDTGQLRQAIKYVIRDLEDGQ